jgi:hypothetical protein
MALQFHQLGLRKFSGVNAHVEINVPTHSSCAEGSLMLGIRIPAIAICMMLLIAAAGYSQANPFFEEVGGVAHTHYGVLPLEVKQLCKKVLTGWKDPFTVYAYVKSGEYEYYAVWGTGGDEEYDRAAALEIRGNVCRRTDLEQVLDAQPPRNGYHGEPSVIGLPWDDSPFEGAPPNRITVFRSAKEETLFREFVRDAIQRAVKAYGGDKSFRSQVCKSKVEAEISQTGDLFVLQEVRAYCGEAGRTSSNSEQK